MIWVIAYLASILAVNAAFIAIPPIVYGGVVWTVGSILCGATFILRDYANRAVGHRVLLATLAGTALTAVMSPALALASGAAFLASEFLDYLVYNLWPGSFRSRVIASSIAGTPLDSALFMFLAGFFSWTGVAVMTASKLIALAFIAFNRD